MITITVTGLRAAAIEAAYHDHFYGIMKSFMSTPATAAGRAAAEDAAREYLARKGIQYNSFWIIRGRVIDTSGTKTPYKAEIDFNYD